MNVTNVLKECATQLNLLGISNRDAEFNHVVHVCFL